MKLLIVCWENKNFWCQKCCIRPRCDQMHWRNYLMSEALHPIVIRSNALTKLSELLSEMTAPNAETIRCTDDVVWCSLSDDRADELLTCQRRCTQSNYDQMHWRICLLMSGGCIWCWFHQTFWRLSDWDTNDFDSAKKICCRYRLICLRCRFGRCFDDCNCQIIFIFFTYFDNSYKTNSSRW